MQSEAINEFFTSKDLITCENTPEVLSKELSRLINEPKLLNDTALNGYNTFLSIYEKTKIDFENFIYTIDKKL